VATLATDDAKARNAPATKRQECVTLRQIYQRCAGARGKLTLPRLPRRYAAR